MAAATTPPTLDTEHELLASGSRCVIGCDEVGRGALAGPVAVGMVVIDATVSPVPEGLRDSKLLSEKRREALVPLAEAWGTHYAVGYASAAEIDSLGIIACLGLAGRRALTALHEDGVPILAATVLLDGNHDWLTPALTSPPTVHTRIKADRDCASVAAASVIAKVHRDRLMIAEDDLRPGFGFSGNKGYGSAGHLAAITAMGPTDFHRRSWLTKLA